MNKQLENIISINKRFLKALIVVSGYIMLIVSFYFISVSCGVLENNIRHLNLSISLITKLMILIFGTGLFKIFYKSIIIAPLVYFFYNYIKRDNELNSIIVVMYFFLILIVLFFSFVLAALTAPFYRILGTLH
jgi:hypothetical protein